jgi:hypothetical protein
MPQSHTDEGDVSNSFESYDNGLVINEEIEEVDHTEAHEVELTEADVDKIESVDDMKLVLKKAISKINELESKVSELQGKNGNSMIPMHLPPSPEFSKIASPTDFEAFVEKISTSSIFKESLVCEKFLYSRLNLFFLNF